MNVNRGNLTFAESANSAKWNDRDWAALARMSHLAFTSSASVKERQLNEQLKFERRKNDIAAGVIANFIDREKPGRLNVFA